MPNHIMNLIAITGEKESIEKFVKENINAYVDEEGDILNFTFQTIIPRPKSLDIESSSRVEDAMKFVTMSEEEKAEYLKKRSYWMNTEESKKELESLGKTALSNLEVYGATDWYDWDIKHWGTKWDCYEVKATCAEKAVYLEFQTAWSTPYPIYQALAEKYKDLTISVEYADEDLGSNCGRLVFRNGKNEVEQEGDYPFACYVWGYPADEYDDEDD